jgi:hypothetical protein
MLMGIQFSTVSNVINFLPILNDCCFFVSGGRKPVVSGQQELPK